MYIGQTGKELSLRIKQHKYCIRMGNINNALFLHRNDNNHNINWLGAKELVYCRDLVTRNIIESSFIKVNFQNLFNISPGMYKLDKKILSDYIYRQYIHVS